MIEQCRLLTAIGDGARADAPVRRADDRHRHPPGAEDGGALADAAPRRREARLDGEPEHDAAGGRRLSGGPWCAGRRAPDPGCVRARRLPLGGRALTAAAVARQRRRPVRAVRRGAVRRPARGHRGDDLRADAPRAAARRDRRTGARDQRQPDQAVRREPSRRRAERPGVVHPPDEQVHERPPGDGVRLRRVRQGRRGQLPQRLRDRLGRRDRSGRAPRGDAGRVPRAGA